MAFCAGSHCRRKLGATRGSRQLGSFTRVTPYSIGDLIASSMRPQDVELELQDLERALLLRARREVLQRDRQAVLDVAPRLR